MTTPKQNSWQDKAARGEIPWTCSDCLLTFNEGMPDKCYHNDVRCDSLIRRDKASAMQEGNEPQ